MTDDSRGLHPHRQLATKVGLIVLRVGFIALGKGQ